MIIALTGTPGTGKTTICGIIGRQYGYNIIDLNKLVIDEGLHSGKDEARDSYIADMEKLKERVKQVINQSSLDIIMEGHLSHLLPADAIIVLRVHPAALLERLGKRNEYSAGKMKENADAEALDVILVESVQRSEHVYEIDTTDKSSMDVAKSVVLIIESLKAGKIPEEYLPGKIDWIEQVGIQ